MKKQGTSKCVYKLCVWLFCVCEMNDLVNGMAKIRYRKEVVGVDEVNECFCKSLSFVSNTYMDR